MVFDVTGKDDRRIMGYGYVIEDNQKYMEHGVYNHKIDCLVFFLDGLLLKRE